MDAASDALRLFMLAVGCVDLGLTVAVFNLYFHANQLSRGSGSSRVVGALPRHILAVSVAHGLMIVALMALVYGELGEPLEWWPSVVVLPAFLLSLFGQYEMLHFQRNRVDFARGTIMITGAPNDR